MLPELARAKIMDTVYRVRQTIQEWNKPIFGICMGHQILGLAAGRELQCILVVLRCHVDSPGLDASGASESQDRLIVSSVSESHSVGNGTSPFLVSAWVTKSWVSPPVWKPTE
jgi:hypothetical protein